MGRSKGAAARRRKAAAARKKAIADVPRRCPRLPPELLANIHDRLEFLDRIAFAAVFSASCDDEDLFTPSPCLLLPGKTTETVKLFSVADRCTATLRAPYPALRDHVVLGSSPRGWLATADHRGQIHVVNPATGEQHELPHITTMGVFLARTHYHNFTVRIKPLLTVRFGSGPPFRDNYWGAEGYGTCTFPAHRMRILFYRKVVLSPATSPRSYGAAMLILDRDYGAPAFATAEDAAWKLAPSEGGVEDAIHHNGRFYSVSYSGVVEAWHRDADSGAYTSTAVAPRLAIEAGEENPRKYLAAAPGGRLMVALKYTTTMERQTCDRWTCSFKVHVLGDDGQWKETRDIGDLALFVGVNNSLCVPTRGRPEIKASCVYFIGDDKLGEAGVYSLKDGAVKNMEALEREQCRGSLTRPVWITPSIS